MDGFSNAERFVNHRIEALERGVRRLALAQVLERFEQITRLVPAAGFNRVEEAFEVGGHLYFELLGHFVENIAPVATELCEFVGHDLFGSLSRRNSPTTASTGRLATRRRGRNPRTSSTVCRRLRIRSWLRW